MSEWTSGRPCSLLDPRGRPVQDSVEAASFPPFPEARAVTRTAVVCRGTRKRGIMVRRYGVAREIGYVRCLEREHGDVGRRFAVLKCRTRCCR